MKIRVLFFVFAAALAACAPLRWSGHPTRITGFTGLPPDPARPLPAAEKEPAPFISRLPLTREDYTQAAKRYFEEAGRYRKEASSHSALKALYGDKDPEMAGHCAGLALQLSTLADRCEEAGKALQKKAESLPPGAK